MDNHFLLIRLFNLNVKSVLNVSQAVAKSMIDNGIAGSIVNMSSQVRKLITTTT